MCMLLQITRTDGLQDSARQFVNAIMKALRPATIVVYV